jgi:hypothetical protein
MRLIKILDTDNITVYLNPRFVQTITVVHDGCIVIEIDKNSCIETADRESLRRVRELFGLT